MYIQRQIGASLVEGQKASLPDGTVFPFKLIDVLPKYVLSLANGKFTSDYVNIASGGSFTVPLPHDYSSNNRLSCIFRSIPSCRLSLVSAAVGGTSVFLIKGSSGTNKGNHEGILMFQDFVGSITLNVPVAFAASARVDYFLWEIPDLDDPDSYRIGERAIGVVGE